jgi:RNA polymerase sigma-70 factor, ECF subfamily
MSSIHIEGKTIMGNNQTMADKEITIEFLMKEYGQRILWLAYSYVKDKNIAEDITQEVFINCYKHLEDFRGEATIKTWLYRICGNRCKDVMKTWSFRSKKLTQTLFDQYQSIEKGPEEALLEKAEANELSLKVLSLPVKYREVIYLHYFENYSLEEICHLLSLNMNTAKSRLHRGRKLLKDMYEGGSLNGK